ncbi:MAG: helix-turn-helix domain-containing protein [Clostridia bacterium]|nr:helix-turn-helix domain-containing protein [Clostridia bacterium]
MKNTVQRFDPRQVMHTDTFEVFHYKGLLPVDFDVHHHDFYEVYLFLSGSAEYWIEGRRVTLAPGDFILINPTELHRSIVLPEATEYERIVMWISKDYLASLSSSDTDLARCFDSSRPSHKNRLRPSGSTLSPLSVKLGELVEEYCAEEWGREASLNAIFLQFMVGLNRLADSSVGKVSKEHEESFVTKVLRYINENYSEELSLDLLAERFFVSKYHLSHAFRREVGVSVYRYIMLKRLLAAKELLLSGMSSGEVAYACGFGDYAGFWRAFKTEYGISPKEFASGE